MNQKNGRDLAQIIICVVILCSCSLTLPAQINNQSFYKDPYVKNSFVKENSFLEKQYTPGELPSFEAVKDQLPQPHWAKHQDAIDCYWKTWEIAFGNLRQPVAESGFVSSYVTTGFNNHIFMWGHVFMLMYWKYALQVFPYQESLENFYTAQHPDGYISREIDESDGSEMFSRFDLSSTGPNIFPWAEWAYYEISGDKERLARVFPVLVANKQWVAKYRTWKDGTYFTSGWGCGMDNQPRMDPKYSPEFDHGHMSWIDITLQQLLMDKILLEMADVLDRNAEIPDIEEEAEALALVVNEKMWNPEIDFYVDRFRDGSISDVKSIGAYWSLLADIVPGEYIEKFCAHLENPDEFDRWHRIPSLSADTPGYEEDGAYWRGGVWAITNYMVLKGLSENGQDSLAHAIAMNHITRIVDRYKETGTIWENYAPEPDVIPRNSRGDFVGFSGVSPVSILFENIFGIRSDVPNNKIIWDVRLLEEHGIKQYPFGLKGIVQLNCKERSSQDEEPELNISSSIPLSVVVKWKGGEKTIEVGQAPLEITLVQKGNEHPAAWVQIQSENEKNIGGWYEKKGPEGFPAYSPVKIKVPEGELSISVWNSNSDVISKTIKIKENKAAKCTFELTSRFKLHDLGYYSFDSHNHLNGYEEINRPPFIHPYCAALGIDRLDLCQGWLFGLRMPVSYDSIVHYLSEHSSPELNLCFGAEMPKLRFGHTWYVNHPGLADPLGDYLNWHDPAYFKALTGTDEKLLMEIDLRRKHHPQWHPPFVDRIRFRSEGAFSVAAHPTRWWHQEKDEVFPCTNVAADLAFDLLTAQSYDGIVVMGDCKDNLYYQNLWFTTLNLGYRLIPLAESDGNIVKGSLGADALTHVWTGDDTYDSESLIENLRAGHTMLSGKSVMLLSVDGNLPPGSVLPADGKKHSIDVSVYSEPASDEFVSWLVLYRNGEVAEKLDLRNKKPRSVHHQFEVSATETAWYVVKSYGKIFPQNDLQFDVLAYAEHCLQNPGNDYAKNTGVSMTAPVFFNKKGWQATEPMLSHIHGTVLDQSGNAIKNSHVEIWNIDEKLAELTTDDLGNFEVIAPASIDVRFTLPNGNIEQQWLFYEYPPLLDLVEDTYTISWAKNHPDLKGGQMPWDAFHYNEMKDVLKEIHWTIHPRGITK